MTSQKSSKQLDGGKKLSLTSMYFNRYLIFRYTTAAFFFVNLYWLILLFGLGNIAGLLPGGLLIGSGAVMIEQVKKYWHHDNNLTITRGYYLIQAVANLILMISVAFGQRSVAYPFLTAKSDSWVIGFLFLGILVSAFLEYRAYLIEHDRDRYLQHIKQFATSL